MFLRTYCLHFYHQEDWTSYHNRRVSTLQCHHLARTLEIISEVYVTTAVLYVSLVLASQMRLQMTSMFGRMRAERALKLRFLATLKPHVPWQWVLVLVALATLWTSEWYTGFWSRASSCSCLLLWLSRWYGKYIL